MALEFCNRLSIETGIRFYYCETSAKTGQNIQETFEYLSFKLLESNNVKNLIKPEIPEGIIDVKETEKISVEVSGDFASKEEFEKLSSKVERIENKLDTMQKIIKKIVEKLG